jgi:flagellar hook-associated protein 2
MQKRKEKVESKKALLGELTNLVEGVRGSVLQNRGQRSLRELKYETNNELIGVSLDKNVAQPGNYQIEVVSLAGKSSAISNGVEDKDETYLGVGYLEYELPNGESYEVYVDQENSSLQGIANLINKDSDNGMRANVVNDGSDSEKPWRLIISLDATGDSKKAEFPYLYFIDGEEDLYFEAHRDAKDAIIKLDGFEIQLPENKAGDIIPGVALDLKKAKPGDEFSLNITEDSVKITEKVGGLVESINKVFDFIKQQNDLDETTDTSRTLGGDITLQTIESRLRSACFMPIRTSQGNFRISDLGISFQRDGKLKFEDKRFENFTQGDFSKVSEILTGHFNEEGQRESGFIDNLYDTVNALLSRPTGTLHSRKNGLQRNIDDIDRQISNKERMIEKKEENLKMKFARLEETINRIKGQGAGLAGLGGGGAPPSLL